MALLDDVETRLDDYGVARIVGSPTTSTGMTDAFATSGGLVTLLNHTADTGTTWWGLISTAFQVTADNLVHVGATSSGTANRYWAVPGGGVITDYAVHQVDIYRAPETTRWAAGLALALANDNSLGTIYTAGGSAYLIALYPSTNSTNLADLYFIRPGVTDSTVDQIVASLTLATSSEGFRIGANLKGHVIEPWYEPVGGSTASRTTYAARYTTADFRTTAYGPGLYGYAYFNATGGGTGPAFDNFRTTALSVDAWTITKSFMPPDPDKCITIYETGGFPPEGRPELDYPTFQVKVRSSSTGYSTGSAKLAEVETALHMFPSTTLNGWYYAGMQALSGPIAMGFDGEDRPMMAQNFVALRSRT